ncbi:MAG: stage II sporulation protein P [Brockia lithotrophica]|nr:stage II sporulation protein P [Brockia lithotrophica]
MRRKMKFSPFSFLVDLVFVVGGIAVLGMALGKTLASLPPRAHLTILLPPYGETVDRETLAHAVVSRLPLLGELPDPYTSGAGSDAPLFGNLSKVPPSTAGPEGKATTPEQELPVHAPKPDLAQVKATLPAVLVYHTHDRESWIEVTRGRKESYGLDPDVNITLVGKAFVDELNRLGVPTLHDTTDIYALLLRDGLAYGHSYAKSREVVETYLAGDPRITYIFDIHRDGVPREQSTVQIDGRPYAKVMFVIGKGNPNWQTNAALAQELVRRLEARYPGITRPTVYHERTEGRNGEYNQSLSPHALTVEIGGIENTREESERTARLLARVFFEYYADAVPVVRQIVGADGGEAK